MLLNKPRSKPWVPYLTRDSRIQTFSELFEVSNLRPLFDMGLKESLIKFSLVRPGTILTKVSNLSPLFDLGLKLFSNRGLKFESLVQPEIKLFLNQGLKIESLKKSNLSPLFDLGLKKIKQFPNQGLKFESLVQPGTQKFSKPRSQTWVPRSAWDSTNQKVISNQGLKKWHFFATY